MKRLILLIALFSFLLLFGCAEGGLADNQANQDPSLNGQNGDPDAGNHDPDTGDNSEEEEDTGNQSNANQSTTNQSSNTNQNTQEPCGGVDCGNGVCDPVSDECVACLIDQDCPQNRVCNDVNQCVQCVIDGDCSGEMVCSAGQQCVGCTLNADCPGDLICNNDQICVDCFDDFDCPGSLICNAQEMCVECEGDSDCAGGLVCNAQQSCVECVGDTDCTGGQVCSAQQVCVDCVDDSDCPDGVCGPDNICAECTVDGDCSGLLVCHPGQYCVECVDNDDCAGDLVCDVTSATCTGCLTNSDCPGQEKCHDQYPVCVAECCDFVVEDVFTGVSYSHDRFDLAVNSDGEPFIVYGDNSSNDLRLAQRMGNNLWLNQTFGTFTGFSVNLRLDLDAAGQPHVVARYGQEWIYHWRDGTGWNQENVWTSNVGSSYTDIKIDSQGNAHFVGIEIGIVHYAMRTPGGIWTRESFVMGNDDNHVWVALGLMSEGNSPVVSASLYNGSTWQIYVAQRGTSGWTDELVVADSTQVHHMVVGDDDEILIVHHDSGLPHNGVKVTRNGSGTWQEEVVANIPRASTLYMDVDQRGDPHIVYHVGDGSGLANWLGYTRWDGDSWENNDVDEADVERAFWQRIAVDDDYVAHIVVYDSSRATISYVTVD